MNEFKVGDEVVCIDAFDTQGLLVCGQKYVISDLDKSLVRIIDESGQPLYYYSHRFKLVVDSNNMLKEGDKVVVVKAKLPTYWYANKIGEVFTVYHVYKDYDDDVCVITKENPLAVLHIEDLELYEENKVNTLQQNIARMEQELAEMKATLAKEALANAYIGDKELTVNLTLDELVYLVSYLGKDTQNNCERLFRHNNINHLVHGKLKIPLTANIYEKFRTLAASQKLS